MSATAEAQAMLRAALVDLETLRLMVEATTFASPSVGLHAQQCAEKAVKAWLLYALGEPARTHDIDWLLRRLASHGENAAPWRRLGLYTPFAGWVRYADPAKPIPPLDQERALRDAEAICQHVAELIGSAR